MGGLTLEQKCELAGLVYETEICLHAAVLGLNTLIGRVSEGDDAETVPRLRVLAKMLQQGNDALDMLATYAEKLLDLGGHGDDEKLALAIETLEFYADAGSWRKARGSGSLIEDDKGSLAKRALARLENDGDED